MQSKTVTTIPRGKKNITPNRSEDYYLGNGEAPKQKPIILQVEQQGSYTSNQQSQQAYLPRRKYTPEEVNYFQEIALGTEFSANSSIIRKWQGDLRIKIIGSPINAPNPTDKLQITHYQLLITNYQKFVGWVRHDNQ